MPTSVLKLFLSAFARTLLLLAFGAFSLWRWLGADPSQRSWLGLAVSVLSLVLWLVTLLCSWHIAVLEERASSKRE